MKFSGLARTVLYPLKLVSTRFGIMDTPIGVDENNHDLETIVMSYKTSIRSILEYGTQVWSPEVTDTCWNKMQPIQNAALRIATGNYLKASIPHLHRETKVLPLRDHSRLLSYQYLAASHLPGHPGREHLGRPPAARQKKTTVLCYEEKVSPLLPTNPTDASYKIAIKALHTEVVEETIGRYPVNKVLGVNPPEVNKEEKSLPRTTRCRCLSYGADTPNF